MSELSWFSAKIRFVCLIDRTGTDVYNDSVLLFRAEDWEDAFQRAIQLGREEEEEYFNDSGERVRWRLKEVIFLNIILKDSLDGVEVHSEWVDVPKGEVLPFETVFHPEESDPQQTF